MVQPHPLDNVGLLAWSQRTDADTWDVDSALVFFTSFWGPPWGRRFSKARGAVAEDVFDSLVRSERIVRTRHYGDARLIEEKRPEWLPLLDPREVGGSREAENAIARHVYLSLLDEPCTIEEYARRLGGRVRSDRFSLYVTFAKGLIEHLADEGWVRRLDGLVHRTEPFSPLERFIEENLVLDVNGRVTSGEIRKRMREWRERKLDPARARHLRWDAFTVLVAAQRRFGPEVTRLTTLLRGVALRDMLVG